MDVEPEESKNMQDSTVLCCVMTEFLIGMVWGNVLEFSREFRKRLDRSKWLWIGDPHMGIPYDISFLSAAVCAFIFFHERCNDTSNPKEFQSY